MVAASQALTPKAMARCVLPTPLGPIHRTGCFLSEGELGEALHLGAIEARLPLEIIGLEAADLRELGAADAQAGAPLIATEHFGLGDAGQERKARELELGRQMEVLIEPLGRVGQGPGRAFSGARSAGPSPRWPSESSSNDSLRPPSRRMSRS